MASSFQGTVKVFVSIDVNTVDLSVIRLIVCLAELNFPTKGLDHARRDFV